MSWVQKHLVSVLVLLTVLATLPCLADTDPVVAVVGDLDIRQSDIDRKVEEVPPVARHSFQTREGQLEMLERIIRSKAMMRAAEEAGYEEEPDIRYQIRNQRERILAYEYFQRNMAQGPLPPEDVMLAYYDKHKDEKYRVEASVEARQIVVESEETAQEIRSRLIRGDISFSDAVAGYSIDESSETNGYLGILTANSFIRGIGRSREFLDMLFSLPVEQVSEPFETRRGWHLVEVIRLRDEGYRPFEDVKLDIAKELLVTEDEIRNEYKENPDRYSARERCKISHILVRTKEDAESVLAELRQGKDFGHLIKQYSIDVQSTGRDGNLGYLYRGGYIRGIGRDTDFENAVFALLEGEISEPLQSNRGWHIVRIDEKEDSLLRPLVEVEAQIRKKITEDKMEAFQEKTFEELLNRFNVTVHEDKITDM
jgi:parvulin-like peptidyl-prolyl isomerase